MTQFKGRREDDRLLTGRGRYTADWNLPGQLHGAFLRSDRAHAEIASLDITKASKSAGVVAILTGEDTAAFRTPPPMVAYPGKGGAMIKVPHRDVIARKRVRYVGQEVALVVATSPAAAQDAAEAIEVDYRDLPAVVDAEAAIEPGAPQLHDEIAGNLSFDYEYGDEKAADAAFARAAHVTRLSLDSTRVSGTPMEPKACVVAYDPGTESFDVYASTQGASMMLPNFVAITGVPADKIRIHAHDVGGGFGIRSQAYPEYCALMLAAKKVGAPVKWVGSRFETIVSDHHGRAARLAGELALDRDGRFLGLRMRWVVNAGAFLSQPGPLINTRNPASHAINVYRIPALYGRHLLALTNTTSTTAYRGAGRPNVSYLVERLVDEAARELGLDRTEIRRRNFIPREAFPYKTPVGSTYDSGDPAGEFEEALEKSDWDGFEARRRESVKKGRLRGIGCAVFCEPSGAGAAPKEEAVIKFGDSGNATLHVLAGPTGQGHETVLPEVIGEILGLDSNTIELKASDPAGPALVGGGTVGSRTMMSHGGALAATAKEVIRKGVDLAAKALEVAPLDVEFANGKFSVKGTDLSITLKELARRYGSELDARGSIPTPTAFPGGAHVAEVEIDRDTGAVEVVRYVAVDDCGRVLNHVLLDGQLHGGIVQGLGQALAEHCIYDDASGQLLTGSFMDYAMPRPEIMTRVELYDHSVPSPSNPLGVKGAGEAGTTGALPAVANAVIDALRPLGIHHLDFPFSPARVWRAITKT
ncbi:MAG TPA: xanthine dehydrogenase family protein molybdopterin-binding subunit [Burkholderiales bacterium]|nr:xanthine dehydrogenase family protein molybdopterin-binding subunit [Burkholderiales bacterium]